MSNLVLYRKYRPLKFADVINQEHVKITLSNAILSGRVGHAYLFTGPRGVGKTTLARIFARALNCLNRKDAEPCNQCEMCKQLLEGTSLDILEIDAASHTGVDNIRELIEHLQFVPSKAKYKVIVIDEVHMLSKGAFNALLKTLEEPPAHAVFILATTEVHKVPATIVSRTQRFDFRKVALADLTRLIEYVVADNKLKIDQQALEQIAEAADGSFRDALSLLDQVINYSDGNITESLVEQILGLTGTATLSKFMDLLIQNKTVEAVNFVSDQVLAGTDLFQFQKDFLEYLRKVFLVKVGSTKNLEVGAELLAVMQKQAGQLELQRLVAIIELFLKAGSELKWAAIVSLPLELAVVEAAGSTAVAAKPLVEDADSQKTVKQETYPEHKEPKVVSSPPPDNSGDVLTKVKEHWDQILEKVKDYNHSLVSSLKLATVVTVEGNELVLSFPYKFHKDTIEARKNRVVIDQVIEDVMGIKLMCKPVLQKEIKENQTAPKEESGNLLKSALKIMGGEIKEK